MSYDNIFDVAALMTDVCIAESSYARECDVQLTVSERVRFKHDANFSQRLALCLMDAQTKSWDNLAPWAVCYSSCCELKISMQDVCGCVDGKGKGT